METWRLFVRKCEGDACEDLAIVRLVTHLVRELHVVACAKTVVNNSKQEFNTRCTHSLELVVENVWNVNHLGCGGAATGVADIFEQNHLLTCRSEFS